MESFITRIKIMKVRHLENIEICLSDTERRHLLITGKNGSGKTSLLETVADCFKKVMTSIEKDSEQISDSEEFMLLLCAVMNNGVHVVFNSVMNWKSFADGSFMLAYFPAGRKASVLMAKGVENIKFSSSYDLFDDPAQNLVKYMVHLKTQQAYARQEGDIQIEENIQAWFNRFEKALRVLIFLFIKTDVCLLVLMS